MPNKYRTEPVQNRIAFLCTGNSARSQMAEALAEARSRHAVQAHSAGSRPKPVHASAVRVMAARGVDISDHAPKHLDTFARAALRLRDQPVRPRSRGVPRVSRTPPTIHWSIPDPAAAPVDAMDPDAAFVRTADDLEVRIRFLLHQIGHDSATQEVAQA